MTRGPAVFSCCALKTKKGGSGRTMRASSYARASGFHLLPVLRISHSRTRRGIDRTPPKRVAQEEIWGEFRENLRAPGTAAGVPSHPATAFVRVNKTQTKRTPRVAVGSGGQTATRSCPVHRIPVSGRYKPTSFQASRIAVTPWPPAAHTEIRPRTG